VVLVGVGVLVGILLFGGGQPQTGAPGQQIPDATTAPDTDRTPDFSEADGVYLIGVGGKIAVCLGTPAGSSEVDRITDITVSDLTKEEQALLEEGIVVGSMAEADALLAAYREEIKAAVYAAEEEEAAKVAARSEYVVVPGKTTWDEAEAYCESRGGTLACIGSQEEYAEVLSLAQDAGYRVYWLGGFLKGSDWYWADGKPVSISAWASGEPNNEGGAEDRMALFNVNGSWAWYDTPSDLGSTYRSEMMAFIMELPA
jgi:nucleotide-binding universal stress UspA family protein